jgi:hypothetical protein
MGPDAVALRTYSRKGAMSDDNGDNWIVDPVRKLERVSGSTNVAGSVVRRT